MIRAAGIAWLRAVLVALRVDAPRRQRHDSPSCRHVEPDMNELRVEDSLEQAMSGYREFLENAESSR